MAFRLKPGKPVASEVCRLAAKQLDLAISRLRGALRQRDDTQLHTARRHIKKIRALARLVRKELGPQYRRSSRRLSVVGLMLAPPSDADAVIRTMVRLRKEHPAALPPQTYKDMRATLLRRKRHLSERIRADHMVRDAIGMLEEERPIVAAWILTGDGFRALAPGLERTFRSARKGLAQAIDHKTVESYHRWRRRVKDHWFQLRLLEQRCAPALNADILRLEQLDEYLGECHNAALLRHVATTDTLDSRKEVATVLRALRRYEQDKRHDAETLGAQIYGERPREFVDRMKGLWQMAGESPERASRWVKAA